MKRETELEGSAALLVLSIDELFKEAYKTVEAEDLGKLSDIEILVKRYFCKKIAQFKIEELNRYNKLMVNFLAWFEWGGQPRWEKAIPIIDKLKTILELSQLIYDTESPQKAYKELKKSSYGFPLVELLYEKKMMRPGEIRKALEIKTMQQVSNLLSSFEKAGIVIREVDGKNVWVTLGMPGMSVYKEYLKPGTPYMRKIIEVLRNYDKSNFEKAEETLRQLKEKEPGNPFVICLSGIIAMEKGDLAEAGKLLTRAVKLGIDQLDKRRTFYFFYILELMKRLDHLKDLLFELNTCRDEISKEIKPTLRLLGLLYEYSGNTSRAREYYREAA